MSNEEEKFRRVAASLVSAGFPRAHWIDVGFLMATKRLPVRVAISKCWTAEERLCAGVPSLRIGCREETLENWPRHFRRHAKRWKATKDEQHIALAALNLARALNGMKPWRAKL